MLFGLTALSHLLDRHADAVRYGEPWVAALRERVGRTGEGASDLAKALGRLSAFYLLNRQFAQAGNAAAEGYALDGQQTWIMINRAHAEMFLDRPDRAMEIHARYRGAVVDKDGKRWPEMVADDFAALRKAGLESPHMEAVQCLLASGY